MNLHMNRRKFFRTAAFAPVAAMAQLVTPPVAQLSEVLSIGVDCAVSADDVRKAIQAAQSSVWMRIEDATSI